jgi:hypothetical protein
MIRSHTDIGYIISRYLASSADLDKYRTSISQLCIKMKKVTSSSNTSCASGEGGGPSYENIKFTFPQTFICALMQILCKYFSESPVLPWALKEDDLNYSLGFAGFAYFFRFKAKKIPYFSLSFALSE